ncbi:MAG: hypothetical protein EXQ70_04260 [Solirubrobacterales bacterium]|nr:hypothetical protein [Solirubrobacterales bacterium]
MLRTLTALACLTVLAVGVGCGESDEQQVRSAVEDFTLVKETGDYGTACDVMTLRFRRQIGLRGDCEQALEEQLKQPPDRSYEIAEVRVRRNRAAVGLNVAQDEAPPSRLTYILKNLGDRWRIVGQR